MTTCDRRVRCAAAASGLLLALGSLQADAQEAGADAATLAKQLSNPISSLISLPFQYNWDTGFGPDDEDAHLLNIQPVIPMSISQDWNLISRTIVPLKYQNDIPGSGSTFGLGDVVQSLFFSPKEPTAGFVWGAGPALLFPTATDDRLGADRWGAGPTAVLLRQDGPVTWGVLANHIWSFAGSGNADISATFLQPFVSYGTKTATTFYLQAESTYDWKGSQWTIPINAGVNQIFKIGGQRIQVGLGGRYWAETPDGGPDWGLRLNFVLLFPR